MLNASLALKLTAGATAALTAGGALAITGNLPDPAQRAVADGAAQVGIDLPGAAAEVGGSGGAGSDASNPSQVEADLDLGVETGS